MASKALNNRKKKEEREQGKANRNKKKQVFDAEDDDKNCPVFSVQYLGKTPAGGEYGREYITEPVETLLRLRDRRPKQQDSALHISEKGFHFLDKNGPFGKEKHVLIPIHHICYGVADEKHPHVFAIITRTDSSSENSLFDCHAFWCGHKKTAQEVTYWLLKTFLRVFNDLQKKRKERQERKLRKQTEATLGVPVAPSPPTSPDGLRDLAMYSVIFEGPSPKGHGAAVRLTRNSRPQTVGSANPTKHRIPPDAADYPSVASNSGYPTQRSPATQPNPSLAQMRGMDPPPVTVLPPTEDDEQFNPHEPRPITIVPGRSQSLNMRGQYANLNGHHPATEYPQPNLPSAMGPNNAHLLSPPGSRTRYEKRPGSRTSSGLSPSGSGSSSGSMTRDSNKDGDFIFIDMLQEAFSDIGVGDSASRIGPRVGKSPWKFGRGGRRQSTGSGSNPLEKLTSEDIERRIRKWLEGDEPNNNIPGNGYSEFQNSSVSQGPVFHHRSGSRVSSSAASGSSTPSTHASGTYGGAEDKHYF
ncbi:uncharacterized protein [Amphiura filiformis]|uniref:uncharacterized protein n=1 Tax=Amphiura filiformis TaxID=82378 RepID=UPI003B21A0B5